MYLFSVHVSKWVTSSYLDKHCSSFVLPKKRCASLINYFAQKVRLFLPVAICGSMLSFAAAAVALTPSRHDVVSRARLTAQPVSGIGGPELPFACSRRAFACNALALTAAARPFASVASIKPGDGGDGTWAEHTGPFDDDFFAGFKSTPTGFKYKFVQEGEGDKPRELQNVYPYAG